MSVVRVSLSGLRHISTILISALSPHSLSRRASLNSCNASLTLFSNLCSVDEYVSKCPHFRGWYVQASVELGPEDVSLLERCPHFRGWYVQALVELGPENVSLLERCPHFRGWYVQASMELEPEDVSLLERCPHFRGWYVQASVELGPENVSLLERCPHCSVEILLPFKESSAVTHAWLRG